MKKIAILASDNMMPSSLIQRDDSHERDEQIKKLYPAFLAQNMLLDIISWKSAASNDKLKCLITLKSIRHSLLYLIYFKLTTLKIFICYLG
jgi:hypothetical protein